MSTKRKTLCPGRPDMRADYIDGIACGSDYYTATYDDDGKPVWSCNNCGHITPRRIRKRGKVSKQPNATQIRTAEAFAKQAFAVASLTTHCDPQTAAERAAKYEVKSEDWRYTDYGTLVLCITIGRKGDEGTMAACLCRNHWQVFIGRKGGCMCFDSKRGRKGRSKKVQGFRNCLRAYWS